MPQRPWQSDAEIEMQMRAGQYQMPPSARRARPEKPEATYGLLIAIGVVFVLQLIVQALEGAGAVASGTYISIFTIFSLENRLDWIERPWSPITATLSHGDVFHLFFNGLFLYFFGSMIERVMGARNFLVLFFASGALSSMAQASLEPGVPALGASGALMAFMGVALIIAPRVPIYLMFFPIPIPLWVAGSAFALMDLLGLFNPGSNIGHFAHLSGLVIGLVYGLKLKQDLRMRGMRLTYG